MAKAYLKIPTLETSQDALIEFFINASSEMLERECDRVLKAQTGLVEYQDGRGQNIILLKQYPVITVDELSVDNDSKFGPLTQLDPTEYDVTDDQNAVVLLGGVFQKGYRNIRIEYSAGYATVPSDLEHACLWLVFWYNSTRNAQDIGRTSKSKEGETVSYLQEAPAEVKNAILRYKRTECLAPNASLMNV